MFNLLRLLRYASYHPATAVFKHLAYMVDFSMEDDPLDSQESNAIWQNLESGAAEQVQETAESVIPPLEPIVPSSSSASTLVVDGQQHFEDSTATSEARSRRISEASLTNDRGSANEEGRAELLVSMLNLTRTSFPTSRCRARVVICKHLQKLFTFVPRSSPYYLIPLEP